MKKRMAFTVALGVMFSLTAPPARAEIRTAELRVNGLVCPFCAFGIEKKLRKLDRVRKVEVFLDEGRVRLAFAAENTTTVRDLEEVVEASGFELAGLRLLVRGTLVREGDREIFEASPRERFRLVEKQAGRSAQLPSQETWDRLRTAARGGAVLIGGEAHSLNPRPRGRVRIDPFRKPW